MTQPITPSQLSTKPVIMLTDHVNPHSQPSTQTLAVLSDQFDTKCVAIGPSRSRMLRWAVLMTNVSISEVDDETANFDIVPNYGQNN